MLSISLTNQEWVVLFVVTVALIIFIGAVVCILYALMGALRSEEPCKQVHALSMVQNKAPLKVCPHHSKRSTNFEARFDKVVLEMEMQVDKASSDPTETKSSFTTIDLHSTISPPTTKVMPSPTDEDSSSLDVEFDKECKKVIDYERRLAETECLMNRLRQQLAEKPKLERTNWFEEEPDFDFTKPALPKAMNPISVPVTSIPEPAISPIFALQSFAEEKPLKSMSARKPLDRGQLPSLKSFNPNFSAPAQPSLLMAPKKPKTFANRRTLKRPHSSVDKPVVHQLIFE